MNGMHDQSERFLRIKQIFYFESEQFRNYAVRPQQFLYFFPLPHGHGSFRPTFGKERLIGRSIDTSPDASPSISTPASAGWGWGARAGALGAGAGGASSGSTKCGRPARTSQQRSRFAGL